MVESVAALDYLLLRGCVLSLVVREPLEQELEVCLVRDVRGHSLRHFVLPLLHDCHKVAALSLFEDVVPEREGFNGQVVREVEEHALGPVAQVRQLLEKGYHLVLDLDFNLAKDAIVVMLRYYRKVAVLRAVYVRRSQAVGNQGLLPEGLACAEPLELGILLNQCHLFFDLTQLPLSDLDAFLYLSQLKLHMLGHLLLLLMASVNLLHERMPLLCQAPEIVLNDH